MKYFIKKTVTLIITLFIVSLLVFLAFQVISDPAAAMLGTSATPEKIAELREELGLNDPLFIRYGRWLSSFVKGDYGVSYAYSMPVRGMVMEKLPLTVGVVLISFVLMVLLSFPLGIVCGRHEGGVADHIITILGQVGMSVPAFLLGLGLTYLFGVFFHWFTPGAYTSIRSGFWPWLGCLIFPALAIAIPRTAMTVKMLRASVIGEMGKDYVVTSYSRGAGNAVVLRRHVLRNAVIPVITFIASSMSEIVANCILVEQVFALPGIGVLLLSSIGNRDFPVVQTLVVFLAVWVVLINFIADVLYQLVDPRIRLG